MQYIVFFFVGHFYDSDNKLIISACIQLITFYPEPPSLAKESESPGIKDEISRVISTQVFIGKFIARTVLWTL